MARVIYNLFFHPLRHFPGPLFNRASRLPWAWHLHSGTLFSNSHALHSRYGHVVRVAPNELSFTDPAAWRDIYGHRSEKEAGPGVMPQLHRDMRVYSISDRLPETIFTASPEKHAMLRRTLAPAFSDKRMREQAPIIGRYVNLLMTRLREVAARGEAANVTNWYTWTTFDLIGDLALGSSLGCLEKSDFHPWVSALDESMTAGVKTVQPLKALEFNWLVESLVMFGMRMTKRHLDYVSLFLQKRVATDVERPDFIEEFVQLEKNKVCDASNAPTGCD